ncbi:MAG: protoporphyrinogen oxidase [Mariniblastus sp.]|nr:protoporphyrinogen oxidase [Mariniblastus sp.]
MSQRYAIIGGGITGLAACLQLERQRPGAEITLIEATDRLGGILQTRHEQGYLVEQSADMFTNESGIMLDLCRQLGAESELIETRPIGRRAYVARGDQLYPVPTGFSLMLPGRPDAILDSEILDAAGRWRLLAERWVPRQTGDSDESLQSFAVRRFGQQAFDRLIQPLISGIYSADPDKLSMRASLGRFVDMERDHGSLIRAAQSGRQAGSVDEESSGARYQMFLAMRNGMQSLVERMRNHLARTEIILNCSVNSLAPATDGTWHIETDQERADRWTSFDGLVLATRATVTGKILERLDPNLSRQLSTVETASMAIVVMGVDVQQIPRAPRCFGFVVPEIENRNLVACSFASNKFSGRAPEGKVLLRCFIGGSLHADRVAQDDHQLIEMARKDLADLVGLQGEPDFQQVIRWRNCMPQYHVGHVDRVGAMQQAMRAHPGLEMAGNSYAGVGIPVCVASGQQAADRLLAPADSTKR